MKNSALTLFGALALAAGVAGCGDGGSRAEDATVAPAISRREIAQLQVVASEQTARCMHEKGWKEYQALSVRPSELNVQEALSKQAFGTDDVEFRRKYGARAVRLADGSPGYPTPGDENPDAPQDTGMSDAESKRLFDDENGRGAWIDVKTPSSGTISSPSGGCYAVGRKAVFGNDLKRWLSVGILVDQFNGMAINEVVSSAPYRAVVSKWSACMKDKGWDNVRDTERGLEPMNNAKPPSDEYMIADAECGAKFGVQKTGEKLESEARARVYKRYEGQLLAWNELVRSAQQRVQKLQ